MKKKILLILTLTVFVNAKDFNISMKTYLDRLRVEAKQLNPDFVDFDVKRGETIFITSNIGKKGKEISCSSCHSFNLSNTGKNIFTNKEIKPLSPTTNSKRLTNVKDVEKWLRRNFKDVYNREGNPQEKGDVLYFINSK